MAITVHFHPDWPHGDRTVIQSMTADGLYRSQFVSGISNGGLTAFPGGDRWTWESRLFSGRYDDAPAEERPVYGAWNRRADPYGAAVRFGSCYVELKPHMLDRATFCFPDSVYEPTDLGDIGALPRLCERADNAALDVLDDYVEAHVHGPVRFDRDVAAMVLDPVFGGTAIETAARRLGCVVRFHPGFRVDTDGLDADFRGEEIVSLARTLSAVLTPDVIGSAARSGMNAPQDLKRVWHYVAGFGRMST